jgi:hypothetical protein
MHDRPRFISVQWPHSGHYTIILSDYQFWYIEQLELTKWCQLHNSTQDGMTVTVPDEHTLTAFTLKWS